MDYEKFIFALELAKSYSRGGETLCLTLSCMDGEYTYWLTGSNFPEDEYDTIEDVIEQLKELNKPKQLFYQGEKCWTLFSDEVKEWFVESIYYDNDLGDYRLSLSNKNYGKASFTQSICYQNLGELFEAQAKKWMNKVNEHREMQHAIDAKKYYEGFGYKPIDKSCTQNQECSTDDELLVEKEKECVHVDDGNCYMTQPAMTRCRKCGEYYR